MTHDWICGRCGKTGTWQNAGPNACDCPVTPAPTDDDKALRVYCTLCGARAYAPCVSTMTGQVNKVPHVARIDNYRRLRQND